MVTAAHHRSKDSKIWQTRIPHGKPDDGTERHHMENPDDGTERHHMENPDDVTERHNMENPDAAPQKRNKRKQKTEAKE